MQGGDELVGFVVTERLEFKHLRSCGIRQRHPDAIGHHDEDVAAEVAAQQRADHVEGVLIEPVHVLDKNERGCIPAACHQVLVDGPGDLLIELAAFRGCSLIAGFRSDAQHRSQQRDDGIRVEGTFLDLAAQMPKSFFRLGCPADATPAFQQPTDRAQADVGVKRRPDQLKHDAVRPLRHFDG